MIMIEQIKEMPIGTRFGGFTKTIKTAKKKWQVDGKWIHQVQLMDKTGDMLADVNIGKYEPLIGGQEIRIIVAEVQETEVRNVPTLKLYVDQFSMPTITEPPDVMNLSNGEPARVIRGKIKTWLAAGCLQSGTPPREVDRDGIDSLVDWIMEG